MLKYERWMTQFDGPELKRLPPTLKDGEKEIIGLWHDESSFHATEYK
jgi:hypothetical protein